MKVYVNSLEDEKICDFLVPSKIKKVWNVEIDIFENIKLICDKYHLIYFAIGGTLLGAIRHKGFIPWDDDIDIAMPRPDNNLFIEIVNNKKKSIKVTCFSIDKRFKDLYAKVYDPTTYIEEASVNRFGFECGVYVDLYPIDGLGDDYESALSQFKKSSVNRELLNAANWKSYERSKTHAWYYELIRLPFYFVTRFLNADKLVQRIERTYVNKEFDNSRFVAIVSGSYREKEILPYDIYRDFISVDFEKGKFSAIKHYDEYFNKYIRRIYAASFDRKANNTSFICCV